MTPEEKRAAYNKLTKNELIELLIEAEDKEVKYVGRIATPLDYKIRVVPEYKPPFEITC